MTFEEFFKEHCIGEVSFLHNHRQIAKLIYSYCEKQYDGNTDTLSFLKDSSSSGFSWGYTDEGGDFWMRVMGGNVNHFYERYPKIKTCKLD